MSSGHNRSLVLAVDGVAGARRIAHMTALAIRSSDSAQGDLEARV
jgi:hypothetical protein